MKIIVTGDFCPILRLENALLSKPDWVLGDFKEIIEFSDLAILNLECPLTNCEIPIVKTGPALKAGMEFGKIIQSIGFNMVTLANNHIMDFGEKGLDDTLNVLDKHQIKYVGAGKNYLEASKVKFFDIDGNSKLAVLNFTENEWSTTHGFKAGANPINPVLNFNMIKDAKKKANHVIVITHGGHELYNLPSINMKNLFHFYIDAGADIVINHHPHCVSGFELYNGKPIFYSLGNFLFDNRDHRFSNWNIGAVLDLDVNSECLSFNIHYFSQCYPQTNIKLLEGDDLKFQLDKIEDLNEIIIDDEKLNIAFEEWTRFEEKKYLSFIEPHNFKNLTRLQNRNLFPTFWSKRKKEYLLNLIRCESHRELLIKILEDAYSNSR